MTIANEQMQKIAAQAASDAKKIYDPLVKADGIKRKRIVEVAKQLNGDERAAYLKAMKPAIQGYGFSENFANKQTYEFKAVFEAMDVKQVSIPVNVPILNEKGEKIGEKTENQDFTPDVLAESDSWAGMVKTARMMRDAAKTASGGTVKETGKQIRALSDDKAEDMLETIQKRATNVQTLWFTDASIKTLAKYYGEQFPAQQKAIREAFTMLQSAIADAKARSNAPKPAETSVETPAPADAATA